VKIEHLSVFLSVCVCVCVPVYVSSPSAVDQVWNANICRVPVFVHAPGCPLSVSVRVLEQYYNFPEALL